MRKVLIVLIASLFFLAGCEDESTDSPFGENTLVAHAGADLQTETNQQLVLDGSSSKDLAAKPFQFSWSIKSKPVNSTPTLEDETTVSPKFTADVAGTYLVELKIYNGNFDDTDEVSINATTANNPPPQGTVVLDQDITTEYRLVNIFDDPAVPDYLVTQDIHVTGHLMIDPSVTIAFEAGQAMYIDNPGSIVAAGWASHEIIFTGKEKTPGYWKGLIINSSSALNKLEGVLIEYGGSNPADGIEFAANLALNNTATLNVESLIIQHSDGYGIVVESGANWRDVLFSNRILNNRKPARVAASHLKNMGGYVYNNTVNRIEVDGNTVWGVDEIYWSRAVDNRTPAQTVPYFIRGEIVVNSGLRIFEGAEFLFDAGAELTVAPGGYLRALGSDDEFIKFHGAESVDGGYWKGIAIKSNHANNELRYVEVYDAGSDDLSGFDKEAAVALDGENHAKLKLTNSKIGKSGGLGLYVENHAELVEFAANQFGYNAGSAVGLPANEVRKINHPGPAWSTFVGNGHNGIEIHAGPLFLQTNEESVWPALYFGASYLVSGNISIQSGLKIMPGAVLKFVDGRGMRVNGNGYLNAQGTETTRITFTGMNETKGSWYGVQFQTNSNFNILTYADVLYAGKTEHPGIGQIASIAVGGGLVSKLTISQTKISHGGGYGVAVDTNLATINADFETVNQFEDLSLGHVYKTAPW
ncbi:hypothetical protein [Gaoshiqia sp. Z1-71]|uniref:hypothetical protein n=1 Tax=Gaoshiqia hydrogeniformans TaxID=3290090 RepID=UPI003BF814A0